MRDIKFRGKRIDNGEWVYGSLVVSKTMYEIYHGFGFVEVDPATVGQYTGMEDKNGVEIYEGDFVFRNTRCEGYAESFGNEPFEVYWDEEKAWFTLRGNDIWGMIYSSYIVAGNVHDNPELKERTNEV